jgi:predicted nucleic acid-binding protein
LMRRLFIDANILVAVLNKEYPLYSFASRVLSLADNKNFELYTTPVCLAISFYFAEKKSGTTAARQKISLLTEHLNVTNYGSNEVNCALNNKSIHDFEDGLEYYSALNAGCDTIVTENTADFYFSTIKVTDSRNLIQDIRNS